MKWKLEKVVQIMLEEKVDRIMNYECEAVD